MRPTLILYTRPGCHLCEDAAGLLLRVAEERPFDLAEVDISGEPRLMKRYALRIPVVGRPDTGAELGWPFEAEDVWALLAAPGAGGETPER